MFQDAEHLASPQQNEVSKLVPLSEKLAVWKLLPNISPWVQKTVERGYRIQFAYRPPRFNGVVSTSVKPERAHLLTQELQTLLDKGAIRTCSPARQTVRLLQPVFSRSQERWGWLRPILDSSRVEPLPQNIQVQNADNQDDCFSHPIGGLVCDNRFKGRLFSYRNIATTQEVPEVRFWGRSLPLSGSSVRPSLVTPHIHEMHGCSSGSSATPGHPHFKLHRRLADSGRVSRACASTSGCRPSSSRISGVETQRQEKRSLSCSEDNVFGGCMGFDHDAGTAVSCTRQIHSKRPKEHQARPESYCSLPSEGSRSHGSCIHGDTIGPPAHEIVSVVLRARGFHPRANPQRQIRVTRQGLRTLSMWFRPRFLTLGHTLGPCCCRKMLTTDASLTGWGAVLDGRPAQGIWRGHLLEWHINYLEMMALFRALKYFLQQLRGYHILVRVDKHSGSLLHKSPGRTAFTPPEQASAAGSALAQDKFLSLRVIYIPGHMNVGADLLSRQTMTHGEWKLHPEVPGRFYEAEVDLFASQETAQCPLYFSLTPPAPLGLDAMAHTWPRRGLYAFPQSLCSREVLAKVRHQGSRLLLTAPRWPTRIWFSDLISLLDGSPWAIPVRRDLLSQAQGTVFHPRPELWNLHVWP